MTLTNSASVNGDTFDPQVASNQVAITTTVEAIADLGIIKAAAPDPVKAGSLLTYTLVISNYGPSNASGILVTDTLDTASTFISAESSQGTDCTPGSAPVCALGDLALGHSARITIVVQVDSAATFTVENTALVNGQQFDPDLSNNETVQVTGVNQEGSLPLLKLDDPDPVIAGTLLTYTLNVSSTGPSDASNVVLTDTLPSQVTFITATLDSGICSYNLGVVVCQLGDMPVGSEAAIKITTLVDPEFVGQINNTAIVGASAAVPSQSSQGTTVVGSADLETTSSVTPNPVVAGQSLTYTIVISNNGPSLARQVLVNNTLPSAATFKESPNCTPAGAAIICNLGNIAAGTATSATFVVDIDPGATTAQSSSATAFANTSDPNLANNSDVAAAQVYAVSDLGISKSPSAASVLAGQLLTYTLTVSNSGPSNASLVQVNDTLPLGVTLHSASSSQGSCSLTNPVACQLGTLPLNASAVVTVVVRVLPSTSEPIFNSASVTAQPLDPESGNDVAEVSTQVNMLADLIVTKVDATDPITAGVDLDYVMTVSNAGPSDARDVVLTDTLPVGMTAVSATASQGGPCGLAGPVTCFLGTITPGQVVTVNLSVAISPAVTQALTNTVEAAAQTADSNLQNNMTGEGTAVITSADVSLGLAAAPVPAIAGELLTYTLTITNYGPSDAAGVVASNQIPPDTLLVSASASQGTECDGNTDINCFLGGLAVGQSAKVTIVVSLDAGLSPTLLEDNASVSAATADPDSTNNSRQNQVALETVSDLAILKSASPDPVAAGSNLTYTLTITNHGPSNASGVVVTDSLPTAATFVSVDSSQGSLCATGPTVTCELGPVAVNAGARITIVATIDAAVTTSVENTAEIGGNQFDPDQSNNV
ncbi:MAG: hypothetical protein ACK2UH_06625, partial [Candidatus Promineifilaceae bacterium]